MTLGQLRGHGFAKKQVGVMVRRGELRRMHHGVYLVGPVLPPLGREMAAAFASGPTGVVSHASATYLRKLLPYPAKPGPVHVTVPGRHRAGDRNLVIHETTSLLPHEIRDIEGIPVTAPNRTLIDLAGTTVSDIDLESAVAEAFALRLTNRSVLLKAVSEAGRRRGAARLRALLEQHGGPKRTRSTPERRLLSLIRGAGLPEPETNFKIGPWEVDFYWPDHELVVEVDDYSTHSSPFAFERDRRKDAELEDRGLSVHRVTTSQVSQDAVKRIRQRLGG